MGDGTNSAHYGYLANSALVGSIAFKQSGTTRMTTTKSYDYVNRLTGISATSAVAAVSFAYAYNSANQRTRVDEADGSYWLYEYDGLGQVTSAKRYVSGGYVVPGQQHEYTYDDIGNRKTAKSGGSTLGTSLRESTYGVNALNQYTNRTVPGYIEVQGSASASATVTVNNEGTTRQGAYYRKELTVNNAPSAVWQGITNIAVLNFAGTNGEDVVTTKTGNVLVPKTPEAFTYDADGNLTADGRFTYTWDAENRLLAVESLTNAPTGAKVKVTWTYDARSRRVQQQSSTWDLTSNSYLLTSDLKFLADGWRHIAELNATNNAPLKTYAWGLDLSGSLDGAGGVGGLLFFRDTSTHFFAYDGNGNVRALFSANDGSLTAQYDYDAFGNILRATGPAALANTFRFSTKRTDDLTSLVLYEYRAYAPWLGRWVSRDYLGEAAGRNLFSYVNNKPVNDSDYLGLAANSRDKDPYTSVGRTPTGASHKIPKCNIEVYIFDAYLDDQFDDDGNLKDPSKKAKLPFPLSLTSDDDCSAGTVVACNAAKLVKIQNGIPGYGLADKQIIGQNIYDQAKDAINAAFAHAQTICDKANCKCTSVTVNIWCDERFDPGFVSNFFIGRRIPECNKSYTYDCAQKKCVKPPKKK